MIKEIKELVGSAREKDPAATNAFEIIMTYSGLHAILNHRVANWMHRHRMPFLPRWISQCSRFFTGIEIHPGAKIGKGLFIDHGMGVVIGETSEIGDNVTIFQGATLGGTGKEKGKRHPTIGDNTIVSAGAKVLGSIEIGKNVIIGAGAVVIRSVPDDVTVVGVPGRIVKVGGEKVLSDESHRMHLPDPVSDILIDACARIDFLEKQLGKQKSKKKDKEK
ncbi:MAG: serine O-acetyltransferase [Actinobacteria bacterium]|nr:serine O-acetyltransferase [Actinomycetota bacterium]